MFSTAVEPKIGVDLVSGHVEHAALRKPSAASSLIVYGALIRALNAFTEPAFPSTPMTGDDFTFADLFPTGADSGTDGTQIDIDWDALGDITTQNTKTNLLQLNEPFLSSNINGRHADGIPLNIDPQNLLQTPEPPSTALTFRDESSSALSERARTYERTDSFLARLPISDPVSQFIATSVLEMIRTYPLMMLRAETLPSFIHGHWYRPTNATQSSLPEPLANCMGIAQIFASHNTESKPYLWNLVKMEQRCFIKKNEHHEFARDDLLAAIQAQIMYIIMRIFDDSKSDQGMNLDMLITHEILCESLVQLCNEPFCQDERLHPSANWEDWVFAESKRRTALVWFLIAQTIHIKNGLLCDTISGFQNLPLSSPKSLWEARTRSAWKTEYEVYQSMSRDGLDVFGDLIDASKRRDSATARHKLDTWNADADNLGIILSLSAKMMTRD
ncbi:hypothetical protein TCE0_060r19286 [Talaromyces pinophilus]|uniref:Transcription factor domain-containing protein n=1 Tax=Talaromyces pinophilus TaxID=128442 RepID=A0A6V8HPN3_TALPI|nr:Hypothetical protein PENO1_102380 [Penicillium occitanis (nom. inval.)]PCG90197.1 hypothetical protein PENOC_103250 [Penicillium occitanis (nom. inval.)]GAM44009.1 hypothetical protein TCE0_060r19286 [Talaromyces pinophilus]